MRVCVRACMRVCARSYRVDVREKSIWDFSRIFWVWMDKPEHKRIKINLQSADSICFLHTKMCEAVVVAVNTLTEGSRVGQWTVQVWRPTERRPLVSPLFQSCVPVQPLLSHSQMNPVYII